MDRLTPAQIRGARGMLSWSMLDLARAAGVSVSTVKRTEDIGAPVVSPATVGQIRGAIEAAGVDFLADEGSGPGMRLPSRQLEVSSRLM